MRTVVEAVAFCFTDALAALAVAGTRPDEVLAIVGGTRSDFLMQMIADSTGCRLGRSDDADVGPALGAARLACAALHDRSQTDVMPRPEIRRWFVPQTSVAYRIQPRLEAYRAMYSALRSVQSALD